MTAIARMPVFVLDCPDPRALGAFYSALTGWPMSHVDDEWAQLDSGSAASLGFQRVPVHRRPTWPTQEVPQQAHLDFAVDDLDHGEAMVTALGAARAEHQPSPGDFRVFLDPAGHPFCLVNAGGTPGS